MKLGQLIKHRFLRDTATLQVGAGLNSIGNLVGAVALAHLLGASGQGEFFVAIKLYTLMWTVVNLGFVGVTVNQVAAATAQGLRDKAAAWLAYLGKAYFLLGLLVAVLAFFLLPAVAESPLQESRREVGFWAAILCITPLIELPRIVVSAALQANRRMLFFAQIENGQEVVRVFLIIVGALITQSAFGAVIGTITASAFGSIVSLELYRRARLQPDNPLPSLGEILARVREVRFSYGLRLGLKAGLVRNIDTLGVQVLPTLILQRFGSSEWVAYLQIAQRLMNVPLMFMQSVGRTILPMFSELAGLKDIRRLRRAYFRASLFSGLLISTGLLAILPILPLLVGVLFPADYYDPVKTMCFILVPGFMVMSFSIANDTFYIVTDTLKAGVYICLGMMVINTSVVAIAAYLNPTIGVAWALSINMSSSAIHLLWAYFWFRRYFKRHPGDEAGSGAAGSGLGQGVPAGSPRA